MWIMRVLFFCNLLPRKEGAYEAVLTAIAAGLQRGGDSIHLVFAGEPIEPVAERLRAAAATWSIIRGWSDGVREHPWRFVLPACRLLRAHRPDVAVVHFGNEFPSLVASLLAPLLGVHGVRWVWEQDQQIADPSPMAARINRLKLLATRFDRFVAVYEGGRRSLRLRGVPDERIAIIYNAVGDHTRRRPPGWLRAELGVPADSPLVLSVGSLIARKRIGFIIEAIGRLASTSRPHLAVVGDGPERTNLARWAETLGVSRRLHFLGLRSDVRDLMFEADVYVHASAAETCTYAISESMATGIPAVVTEAGAAREQIEDGVSGFVVNRDDLDGFASRIDVLVRDRERRREMGAAARRRWEASYRVETAARRYCELYRALAAR
jgi:glycosyltransferase involved in cell wall biosynthesis